MDEVLENREDYLVASENGLARIAASLPDRAAHITWLDAEHFTQPLPQLAWAAFLKMQKKGKPINPATIAAIMAKLAKRWSYTYIEGECLDFLSLEAPFPMTIPGDPEHVTQAAEGIARASQRRQRKALPAQLALKQYELGYTGAYDWFIQRNQEIDAILPEGIANNDAVIRLSDVPEQQIEWLWPSRIPRGKITDVFGMPNYGKSLMFGAEIPARITTGRPNPDGTPCVAGSVLYLCLEDGLSDTIKPRIRAAGGDDTKVFVMQMVKDAKGNERPVNLEEDFRLIEKIIVDHEIVYVLIDPIMSYLGKSTDSYKEQDVRRVLSPYAKLAERTNAAIVMVRHPPKGGNSQAMYGGGGSTAFTGLARISHMVTVDPDDADARLFSVTKCNICAVADTLRYCIKPWQENPDIPVIEWGTTSPYHAEDINAKLRENKTPNLSETTLQILAFLSEHPDEAMSPKEIAEALGTYPEKLHTQLYRLADRNLIKKTARGLYLPLHSTLPAVTSKECKDGKEGMECKDGKEIDPYIPYSSYTPNTETDPYISPAPMAAHAEIAPRVFYAPDVLCSAGDCAAPVTGNDSDGDPYCENHLAFLARVKAAQQ